jgi:hypothetical protein
VRDVARGGEANRGGYDCSVPHAHTKRTMVWLDEAETELELVRHAAVRSARGWRSTGRAAKKGEVG